MFHSFSYCFILIYAYFFPLDSQVMENKIFFHFIFSRCLLFFFFLQKSVQVLEWAAQGGGGVTVPGSVQETFRCCTEGHGLVGNIGGR